MRTFDFAAVLALALPAPLQLGAPPGAPAPGTTSFALRQAAQGVRACDVDGRWALFTHDESGTDRNGDGDALDRVYAVHDLVSGGTTELGLASGSGTLGHGRVLAMAGGRAVFTVRESAQGGSDLNADGDADDLVYHGVDLATATARGSGLAATEPFGQPRSAAIFVGSRAVILASEANQGSDLDGNGEVLGTVPHVWDDFAATPRALSLPADHDGTLATHRSFLLFGAYEAWAGDLNGDGSTQQVFVHAVDLDEPSLAPIDTGLSLVGVTDPLQAAGPRSAFLVHELAGDLNGDGDGGDWVLHTFDLDGPALENSGLAVRASSAFIARGPDFLLSEDALAFAVSEEDQQSDLNGDGRVVGSVLFVRDFASDTTTNLGLSVFEFVVGERAVAFAVPELDQNADLNGDGAIAGHVAHLHDLDTGTTTNLGLRISPHAQLFLDAFALGGDWLALRGLEEGVDRNGDGDGVDAVLHFFRRSTGALSVHGVALADQGDSHLEFAPDGWLSLRTTESVEGRDLNGDGDLLDRIVQYARPDTGARVDPFGLAHSALPGARGRHAFLSHDGSLKVLRLPR